MTANQLAWLNYQETQRSNLAKEAETKRSNLVKEAEINRSNLENELLKEKQVYADSANKLLPGLGLLSTEGLNISKKTSGAKPGESVGLLNVKSGVDTDALKKGAKSVLSSNFKQSTVGKAIEAIKSLKNKRKEGK